MTFALILIDPQNRFINDGFWSRSFLWWRFHSDSTKFSSNCRISSITRVLKPQTNLSKCEGVHSWLNDQLTNHRNDIVIGGSTITSCVRHSSIEMKKDFPQLNFFVDRHLCGARKENYFRRCSPCFDRYLIDGSTIDENYSTCRKSVVNPLKFFSPVEFAFQ